MSAAAKWPLSPLEARRAREEASRVPQEPPDDSLTSEPRSGPVTMWVDEDMKFPADALRRLVAPPNGPVTITLLGDPVAVSRVRFTQSGRAFTPTRTRNYLGELQQAAKDAMQDRAPLEGPLCVVACFEVRIPKASKLRTLAMMVGKIKPAKRPDLDNLLKGVDALTGVVWRDDAQIVELHASKHYGMQPKVIITVKGDLE